MLHLLEVESFQQAKGLAQIRSLRPRSAFVDGVPPVIDGNGVLHGRPVCRQVALAKEGSRGDVPLLQLVGDVSLVEAIPRRRELLAPVPGVFALRFDEFAERHGKVGVPVLAMLVQQPQHRPGRLLERHGPVELQEGDAKIDRARHRRRLHAASGRNPVGIEPLDRLGVQRRPAQAAEDLHFPLLGVVDEERNLAADGEGTVIRHRQRQERRGGRVGRVSPALQDPDSRLHRAALAGRDRPSFSGTLPGDRARLPCRASEIQNQAEQAQTDHSCHKSPLLECRQFTPEAGVDIVECLARRCPIRFQLRARCETEEKPQRHRDTEWKRGWDDGGGLGDVVGGSAGARRCLAGACGPASPHPPPSPCPLPPDLCGFVSL